MGTGSSLSLELCSACWSLPPGTFPEAQTPVATCPALFSCLLTFLKALPQLLRPAPTDSPTVKVESHPGLSRPSQPTSNESPSPFTAIHVCPSCPASCSGLTTSLLISQFYTHKGPSCLLAGFFPPTLLADAGVSFLKSKADCIISRA